MTIFSIKKDFRLLDNALISEKMMFAVLFDNIISNNSYYEKLKEICVKEDKVNNEYLLTLGATYFNNFASDTSPYKFLDDLENYLEKDGSSKRRYKFIKALKEGSSSLYSLIYEI